MRKLFPIFFSDRARHFLRVLLLLATILAGLATTAAAWPSDSDWIPIYRGADMLSDPQKDAAGSRDIVGNATNSAAYVFNDGNYIYFRVRVDADPRDNSGTALGPFGWGFLLDTNNSLDDYEYMIMLDGINNPDVMYLARNTVQGIIGDPSDKAELILWQEYLTYDGNYRVLGPLDSGGPTTTFGGDGDYFADWFIPYNVFKNSMALTDSSTLRYFVGSSNSAQTLSADLVAGSTLYDGSSNYVLPSGKQPTTGSISFVADAAGTIDLTEFYAENPAYLKVIDGDQNTVASQIETVTVTVTAASGDSQSFTLTETGPNTGIFVGPLATENGTPVPNDGLLQVSPIEIVTATYLDGADGNNPPLLNQTRTDTARVLPAADIAVSKSVDDPTPVEGEMITYSVAVENLGPSSASGIQVVDQLPTQWLDYDSHVAPAGTSYNPGTGLWSVGTLAKNDPAKVLTITARIKNGAYQQTIVNTASLAAASQPDPNPANNSDSVSVAITGSDLTVSKGVSNMTPAVGGAVTFTVTVVNNGSHAATNLALTDLLPAGTWSDVANISASLGSASYIGDTLHWNVGTLPHPGTATLTFNATLAAGVASGTLVTNTASITQVDQSDPNPADDTASVTLLVGGIDLAVSKVVTSPSPATPDENGLVIFTVTVGNSASSSTTATGVEVTDILPNGLNYVSATTTQGAYASGNGKWNVGSLASNASATLTLTARVAYGQAGNTLTNTATITGYIQSDVNTNNHTASASVTVRATDLRVEKTVNNQTPNGSSGSLTYTVTVTNLGSLQATGVTIFDQLPGVTTLVTATASQGSYSTATWLWTVGTLDAGASATLTLAVTYSLGQNDPRTFFNTAALQTSTPGDNNAANNVATAVVSVEGTDLGLTKTMNTGYTPYPATNTSTQFLITLTNYGPNPATGIVVKDLVPTGLACTSGTPSVGSFVTNKCEWSVANLAVGASATLVFTSAVTAATGTIRTNQATITTANQTDPYVANNTASQTVYIGASDLNLSKVVDNPTPNIGERVKFTITLSNDGPNNVDSIVVTDLIPSGLTLLTAGPYAPAPSQGSYNNGTGVWTVGTVNYPGIVTLDLYATVNAGTAGTVITNTAEITAAGALDFDGAGRIASATVTVPLADLYVTKEADSLTPDVGETVTFTIVAGNNGPNNATGVVVRDLLASTPDGETAPDPVFSNLIINASPGTSYDPASGNWSIGPLAKGATRTLTITATVNPGSEDLDITNSASINPATLVQPDNNPGNNSATIVITPRLLKIDLQLTKTVDSATPIEGSNSIFTVTLYNLHGGRTATGVVVTDTLPAGLTFVSAVPSAGTSLDSAPAVGDSGAIVWNIGSLAAMSNVSLVITAKTACGSAGTTYTNSATISANDQADPNLANNSASAAITAADAQPSLLVVKSASGVTTANPGQILTYMVQLLNTGCGEAVNIEMKDRLSPYTEWRLSFDGAGGGPFTLTDNNPPSGVAMGTPKYSDDHGANWDTYIPVPDTGDPATGFDSAVTNWKLPLTGTMKGGSSVTLRYQTRVE